MQRGNGAMRSVPGSARRAQHLGQHKWLMWNIHNERSEAISQQMKKMAASFLSGWQLVYQLFVLDRRDYSDRVMGETPPNTAQSATLKTVPCPRTGCGTTELPIPLTTKDSFLMSVKALSVQSPKL